MNKFPLLILVITLTTFTISDETWAYGSDVYECIHVDVPTGKEQFLGLLVNPRDICSMYANLIDDELHDNPWPVKGPKQYIEQLLRGNKVHDPEVCLLKTKILGVEE